MKKIKVFEWIKEHKEELMQEKSIIKSMWFSNMSDTIIELKEKHFEMLEQLEDEVMEKEDKFDLVSVFTLDKPLENEIWGQINNILAYLDDLINDNLERFTIWELFYVTQQYYKKIVWKLKY